MASSIKIKYFGTLCTALTAGLMLVITPGCTAFSTQEETKRELFSAAAKPVNAKVATGPTVLRARFVSINFGLLTIPTKPSKRQATTTALRLNLFEDTTFNAVLDRIETRSKGSFTWFGHVKGTGASQVTLVVEKGVMAGNIRVPGLFYQVRYAGTKTHVIYQINALAFPPDSVPLEVPAGAK